MRIISLFLLLLTLFPCTHLAKKPKSDKDFIYQDKTINPHSSQEINKTIIDKNNEEKIASSSNTIIPAIKWTDHKRKHFSSKKKSWEKIVASTKNGPAKYRPNSPIEQLEREVWENGRTCDTYKIMEFNEVIGASKGKETSYVKVEYDSGTNTIHGHPITSQEYDLLMKRCN